MKQATVKTLGAAAVGAAFAVTAAGGAAAADHELAPLGSAEQLTGGLPLGAHEAMTSGDMAIDHGIMTLPAVAHHMMPHRHETLPALPEHLGVPAEALDTQETLLGGLPLGQFGF
ncbi:hypothetical protein GCM10009716_15110 [Streptomyces sodiiphilus]|uniref:Secreted protein n=1 Tax=Streptomyces sodiiphilus TaxID=226217 RepID=A0ABN2NX78_9ACTN